jgi:hypothetical protein
VLGTIVVATRGLPAFIWFTRLFEQRVKVFEGPHSEARAFEDACNGAGIPCEIHVENRDRTMQVRVTEKRAANARRLLSR